MTPSGTTSQRLDRDDRRAVAILVAGAAALRVAYVWTVSDDPAVQLPLGDALAYHRRALEILGGKWIGDDVFYQDPLFPYLLAGLYAAFGVGSFGVLVAQSLLDALAVGFVFGTARIVFDRPTAWLAGVLAATNQVLLFYDAFLLKVPLTGLLAAVLVFALVRADTRRTAAAWGWAAGALGLASLTRGNYLVFAPFLFGWAVLLGVARGVRVRAAGAVVAGLVLTIGPVALRNYAVAGDVVLITSQAGQNFYIGNQRGNASGVYLAPPFVVANAAHEQTDFRDEAERRVGESLSPSELSRYWMSEGLREIAADPAHFARHTLRKFLLFTNHYEIPDNYSFEYFRERVSTILALPLPGFGLLLPLAAGGVFLARRRRSTWLLVSFFAAYAASVVLFFNVSRYRVPILPVVFVFAAWSVARGWALIRARELPELAVTAAVVAAGLMLTLPDRIDEDFALYYANLGAAHTREAKAVRSAARAADGAIAAADLQRADALYDRAEVLYRAGLDEKRRDPHLRTALKDLLLARIADARADARFDPSRLDSGVALAERLNATYPGFAEGFALRGELYEAMGDRSGAIRSFEKALEVSAGNRRARAGLGRVRGP